MLLSLSALLVDEDDGVPLCVPTEYSYSQNTTTVSCAVYNVFYNAICQCVSCVKQRSRKYIFAYAGVTARISIMFQFSLNPFKTLSTGNPVYLYPSCYIYKSHCLRI